MVIDWGTTFQIACAISSAGIVYAIGWHRGRNNGIDARRCPWPMCGALLPATPLHSIHTENYNSGRSESRLVYQPELCSCCKQGITYDHGRYVRIDCQTTRNLQAQLRDEEKEAARIAGVAIMDKVVRIGERAG